MLTIDEYESLLKQSGFSNVKAEDRTELFEKYLLIELEKFRQIKDEFIREFSESDYNEIVDGWNEKIKRVAHGEQKWGVVYAEKIKKVFFFILLVKWWCVYINRKNYILFAFYYYFR